MTALRRLTALFTALCLAFLGLALGLSGPASAADSGVALTDSAVTVSGTGAFVDLKVTVAQTEHLINQFVPITWTGGAPTSPTSRYGINYLQIMQCWGEDPAGPDREQCQFGGILGDSRGGSQSSTRQVSYGSTLVDPLETYVPPPGSFQNVYVPFKSVTGKTTEGSRSEYFDAGSTNEVPYARTNGDGRGQQLFEVQTEREAPGLGCGALLEEAGEAVGRSCWLVIVPRNDVEVDGTKRSGTSAFSLDSSPLSASNWSHRLVVPLKFEPLGAVCPFGKERKLAGQELAVEAVSRWQPALCTGGGATYSYSQVSDSLARRQLVSPQPALVLTSRPVEPAAVPPTRPIRYAPVSIGGVAIAFIIERQTTSQAPEDLARDGTRVVDLKLTPRLVAKLLTESYVGATPDGNVPVHGNPQVITLDPEFVALNPEFVKLGYTTPSDALVPLGDSDMATLLWQWIGSDKQARAWLDGKADPWGMVVNPAYKNAALPFENFPKSDPYCQTFPDGDNRLDLCTLERRPYAADFHDAARSAARGDALTRETWDPLSTPPAWKKSDPQYAGTRAVFAVTDTSTAARFGLQVAKLLNASGAYVAPTATSMGAALSVMREGDVRGVLEPNLETKKATAYPLTLVTYAATAPAALTKQEGKDYAAFLRYAASDGQKPGVAPGELPEGYLPLTPALRAQSRMVATQIETQAAVPVAAPSSSTDTSSDGTSDSGSGSTDDGSATPSPSASATPSVSPSPTDVSSPRTTAVVSLTPNDPVGPARYALVAALVLGSLAALTGLALLRISRRAP